MLLLFLIFTVGTCHGSKPSAKSVSRCIECQARNSVLYCVIIDFLYDLSDLLILSIDMFCRLLVFHHGTFFAFILAFTLTQSPLILQVGLVLGCLTTWQTEEFSISCNIFSNEISLLNVCGCLLLFVLGNNTSVKHVKHSNDDLCADFP